MRPSIPTSLSISSSSPTDRIKRALLHYTVWSQESRGKYRNRWSITRKKVPFRRANFARKKRPSTGETRRAIIFLGNAYPLLTLSLSLFHFFFLLFFFFFSSRLFVSTTPARVTELFSPAVTLHSVQISGVPDRTVETPAGDKNYHRWQPRGIRPAKWIKWFENVALSLSLSLSLFQ